MFTHKNILICIIGRLVKVLTKKLQSSNPLQTHQTKNISILNNLLSYKLIPELEQAQKKLSPSHKKSLPITNYEKLTCRPKDIPQNLSQPPFLEREDKKIYLESQLTITGSGDQVTVILLNAEPRTISSLIMCVPRVPS